jgi:uncharacterized cofD-like protein
MSAANPAVRALKVVAIGGGTGLSTLLKGLKHYVALAGVSQAPAVGNTIITDLSAVVTVTDDGGSSGRLRKELNVLPPGDIRNCMVALSEDEALLSRLFQYRFEGRGGLEGHNFGNLFLTALASVTGDFTEAVTVSSAILASRGTIYPATTANVQLEAVMDDGSRVHGETNITASQRRIMDLHLVPPDARPLPQSIEAIRQADLITIGPGSLFTSLIPNLLVRGVPEAIAGARATRVFVCNLMTQANESLGLSAADHIRAIYKHAGQRIFDCALLNSRPVSAAMQQKYAVEGAAPIAMDIAEVEALGVRAVSADLLEEGDVVRHDWKRLARELLAAAYMRTGH